MNTLPESSRSHAPRAATYAVRLARDSADIEAAQRLRFEVFNLELNEGLDTAYLNGLDADQFDECCDHLLVEDTRTGVVVGTYRLQTGQLAAANHGYYSAQEFDFAPFESIRCETVELGRACVQKDHRKLAVLNLLWRGIVTYATERKARYLIGCSSLTSQDAAVGTAMYEVLCNEHLTEERWRTEPTGVYRIPDRGQRGPHLDLRAELTGASPLTEMVQPSQAPTVLTIPKLLRAYLSLGARICGPPALDQAFKTIDFLTLLDLHTLPAAVRQHFLG